MAPACRRPGAVENSARHEIQPRRAGKSWPLAQAYPENPKLQELNNLAWELVKLPGGEMSGYRKAPRSFSEEACQLEAENGDFLSTLGVAGYRVGNCEEGDLDVLSRQSDTINASPKTKRSRPTDLAFLWPCRTSNSATSRKQKQRFRLLRGAG